MTVRAPGKEPYTFTVDAAKTSFSDWHAAPGKNVYLIKAVFDEGEPVSVERVVYMGPNGEPSTAAAVESAAKAKEKKSEEKKSETSGTTQAGVSVAPAKAKLSAETRAALEAKFDSIPEEKRETFYMNLITRVDTAIAKALANKQPKTAALLREIRAMVEERLNAMDTPDEGGLVQDLLDGEE